MKASLTYISSTVLKDNSLRPYYVLSLGEKEQRFEVPIGKSPVDVLKEEILPLLNSLGVERLFKAKPHEWSTEVVIYEGQNQRRYAWVPAAPPYKEHTRRETSGPPGIGFESAPKKVQRPPSTTPKRKSVFDDRSKKRVYESEAVQTVNDVVWCDGRWLVVAPDGSPVPTPEDLQEKMFKDEWIRAKEWADETSKELS